MVLGEVRIGNEEQSQSTGLSEVSEAKRRQGRESI
jgi:hypothetical protein